MPCPAHILLAHKLPIPQLNTPSPPPTSTFTSAIQPKSPAITRSRTTAALHNAMPSCSSTGLCYITPPLPRYAAICLLTILLLSTYWPAAAAHDMGEDSRLDNSPWSAPGPWARRGAEFTGNSPHAAEPPKPNSDACISQGELLAACWLGLRCFLDLAGIFWVTLVSVLLSAWLSWRPSLSLRQRTTAVKGYMHGRTAQCGFGKHDDGRWLLRWPRRAANRNLPKPKAHRFSQCHLYATAAAVTVTTLCCALYQLLCFTQQIPGVLCQWYWGFP